MGRPRSKRGILNTREAFQKFAVASIVQTLMQDLATKSPPGCLKYRQMVFTFWCLSPLPWPPVRSPRPPRNRRNLLLGRQTFSEVWMDKLRNGGPTGNTFDDSLIFTHEHQLAMVANFIN